MKRSLFGRWLSHRQRVEPVDAVELKQEGVSAWGVDEAVWRALEYTSAELAQFESRLAALMAVYVALAIGVFATLGYFTELEAITVAFAMTASLALVLGVLYCALGLVPRAERFRRGESNLLEVRLLRKGDSMFQYRSAFVQAVADESLREMLFHQLWRLRIRARQRMTLLRKAMICGMITFFLAYAAFCSYIFLL